MQHSHPIINAKNYLKEKGISRPIFSTLFSTDSQTLISDLVEFSSNGGIAVIPASISFELFEKALNSLKGRPFAVALTIPPLKVDLSEVRRVSDSMSEFWAELGTDNPLLGVTESSLLATFKEDFEARFNLALEYEPLAMISLSGGFREPEEDALRQANILNIGVATTLREAKVLRAARVNAIIAQGQEAEGPRQNFEDNDDLMLGLVSLVPSFSEATKLPIIPWGGIYSKAQLVGLEAMGGFGAVVSSAIPLNSELKSRIDEESRIALELAAATDTKFTRVFNGKLTRIFPTSAYTVLSNFDAILTEASYPAQSLISNKMMQVAKTSGETWLNFEFRDASLGRANSLTIAKLLRNLLN